MASIPCDIVLLPSDELAKKAIILSRELQAEDALFTLDGRNYYPHVSLYMAQLRVGDLDKTSDLLADIAVAVSPLDLSAMRYHQVMGFFDVEYQRSATLDRLQTMVIEAVNPWRAGMRESEAAQVLEATGLAGDNFKRYGYKYIGDLFRPHLTITRLANDESIDVTGLPGLSQFGGQFAQLGLFELGENNTCIREVAAFNLG